MAARTRATKAKESKKVTRRPSKEEVEVKAENTSKTSKTRKISNRNKVIIVGLVIVGAYLLYVSKGLLIAATVNGTPIPRISVVKELEKQGGKQILDTLVNEALIKSEAKKAGIEVSSDEIDKKIADYTDQAKAQGQDLNALLEQQGLSQEDFKNQIKVQIYIEKLMEDKVSVTDDEVASFIETNKDFLPKDKSAEELNALAKDELKQQKLSSEFSKWLSDIKGSANINYFVEY